MNIFFALGDVVGRFLVKLGWRKADQVFGKKEARETSKLPPSATLILLMTVLLCTGACGGGPIRDFIAGVIGGAGDQIRECREHPEKCLTPAPPIATPIPTPTPTPTPEPTPTWPPLPMPTSMPTPVPTAIPPTGPRCILPAGAGDGVDCPRTSARLLYEVDSSISDVIQANPSWFQTGAEIVLPGHENDFRYAVVDDLRAAGLCAFFDGEEVALKNINAYSEQYAILSSANHVRRGENSYRATCTPAWSAIPATPAAAYPPLLVLQKVGNDCHNPKEGPRFINRHECDVDSTAIFRDPTTPEDTRNDGPCDRDHQPSWTTFCHYQSWDDPRGPIHQVDGAESWTVSSDNPNFVTIVFTPGVSFTVCTTPRENGPTPVLRPASQCKSQVH